MEPKKKADRQRQTLPPENLLGGIEGIEISSD
jgi:hypothetical protein